MPTSSFGCNISKIERISFPLLCDIQSFACGYLACPYTTSAAGGRGESFACFLLLVSNEEILNLTSPCRTSKRRQNFRLEFLRPFESTKTEHGHWTGDGRLMSRLRKTRLIAVDTEMRRNAFQVQSLSRIVVRSQREEQIDFTFALTGTDIVQLFFTRCDEIYFSLFRFSLASKIHTSACVHTIRAHTQTHTYVGVLVCVCVFIYVKISLDV